jgi:hypothetical protein
MLVKMSIKEMSVEDKAEFLIAVRNYRCQKRKKWAEGMDYKASDKSSDGTILLRSIASQGKTGFVGINDVKNMLKVMKREDCASGVLIGRRFTDAATREMTQENIQKVSDEYMPPIEPNDIFLTINDCVNSLCRAKCGEIPRKEDDCKGRLKESYCNVRSISDNASFHFEHGWVSLMKNDLRQLLSLNKPEKMRVSICLE